MIKVLKTLLTFVYLQTTKISKTKHFNHQMLFCIYDGGKRACEIFTVYAERRISKSFGNGMFSFLTVSSTYERLW